MAPESQEKRGQADASQPPDSRTACTARHVAEDLHRALHNAGIAPPYLLVGNSAGGLYSRVFAHLCPDEVAGMVLVEPSSGMRHEPREEEKRQMWLAFHRRFVERVPGARHIISEKSGHGLANTEPELVVGAVHELVDQIRGSKQ